MQVLKVLFVGGVFALLAVLAFNSFGGTGRSSELDEVSEVIEQLRDGFIDQERLSTEELNEAAIRGILEFLDDPFTSFLSSSRFESLREELSGEGDVFGGIGAEVTLRDGQLMILAPFPDSPASRAGLEPGDTVLAVNGQDVEGLSLLEAVSMIRGPEGTTVELSILHPGEVRPREVSVVRDTIEVTSVSARMLEPDVGYIRLASFDAVAAEGVRDAIERLRDEGANGLVFDLRNNPGGLVQAAIDVASEFLENGPVFVTRDGDGSETEDDVTGKGTAFDLPLVVIVNGFSASASEIVAGAMQDHDRATVVGTRTFGKGSVNELRQLKSGAGLRVTTAIWLTPNGRLIQDHGLEPDVLVGDSIDVRAAQRIGGLTRSLCEAFEEDGDEVSANEEIARALNGLCNLQSSPPPPPGDDQQLEVAIAELRALMAR